MCPASEAEQCGCRCHRLFFPLHVAEQRGRVDKGVAETLTEARVVIPSPRVAWVGAANRLGTQPILVAEPIGFAFGIDNLELAGARVENGNRRLSAESQNSRTGRELFL
jgi:hypothetical protein